MKRLLRTLLLLSLIAAMATAFILGVNFLRRTLLEPRWKIAEVPPSEVINFVLYTVDHNVLNLTAHLYRLDENADRTVRLEIRQDGKWREIAAVEIWEPEFIAPFQIQDWDDTRAVEYRVRHGEDASYTGLIRANPVDQEEIVVAAFACNGNSDRGSRRDVINNIEELDPDLLFFSGDQVYDHHTHFLSWHLFGRQFGEITRSRPTVVIPDDHDVGNANLWGSGGEIGFGGYHDPAYVRMVENTQTSHLPDPYDPTPIKRGIGTYYTSLTWGRIGFAILEDRKFKSRVDILDRAALEARGVVFSRPDHLEKLPDPTLLDVPEGKLLGERQLAFLEKWAADWSDQDMKAVLSQAPFAGTAHLHGPGRTRLAADLDSNGWPQSGRDRALRVIRKGFAFMIQGDTHLATVVHHGVEDFGDSGCSFTMPAVVSIYRRWWSPAETPGDLPEGSLAYTGETLDPLGNKITMLAYANPDPSRIAYDKWAAQGAGFGIIRFNKPSRTITMELWPRGCDMTRKECQQYPGWPITITQEDNYGREAYAYLPTIQVTDAVNPVLQVIHEQSGEILYTLRIKGLAYRPKVFQEGTFTVVIRHGENLLTLTGLEGHPGDTWHTLQVSLKDKEDPQ